MKNNDFVNAFKIFKHEFLMSRAMVILSIALLAFIGMLSLAINNNSGDLALTSLILICFYAFGVLVVTYFIVAIISFYHGVFGKNAYLTHSLPVGIDSIILSKIFVFTFWGAVIIFEFCLFAICLAGLNRYTDSGFSYLYRELGGMDGIIKTIVFYLFSLLNEIIYVFMIVAIVHRKKSWTLVYGIVIYFAIKILIILIYVFFIYNIISNGISMEFFTGYYMFIVSIIILSLIFYFITRYIITRKLVL